MGGGTSGVLNLHEGTALTLALSGDDHSIVMNFMGNLWTLPATGGTATRISSLSQDTAYPTWSPDGKTIAFQSYKSGNFHVWAMNPNGSNVRELTFGYYDDREPVFSPDGTQIAFSSDRPPAGSPAGTASGSYNVWVLTLATGQLTEITHDAVISINGGAPKTVPVDLTWRPQAPPSGETVIHAGRLWAGTSDAERSNVDIVVRGNKIVSVGPARRRSTYGAGVHYVNASKDTVIPGLWESHAHEGMDQPFAGGRTNRLELAMGITTEISMGDEPYHSLEEVESQQSGAAPGPRYFWSAEPIDGSRIFYAWMRADPTKAALTTDLARLAKLKPDILKTYVRLPNSYEQIAIQAGHTLGIPSFSHYFWPALAYGQDGGSHWATQRLGYQIAVSNDVVAYQDTIQLYARSGMSITTTPYTGAANFLPDINGKPFTSDPRVKALQSPWQYALAQQEFAQPPLTAAGLSTQVGTTKALKQIVAAGGTVLIGTDNPIGFGNFGQVIAISEVAQTGLGNYQALRAATVEPAKDMGVSNQLGTIRPGMIADMDVIHGNPLRNIETIANDVYVMQNGHLYTPRELIGPYSARSAAVPSVANRAPRAARRGVPVWETPGELARRAILDLSQLC